MSRVTAEETNIFLIKCIKHSNNGKVDFASVAEECGIVSKGAAAKRYERILKGNGIHPSSSEGGDEDGAPGSANVTPKKNGTSSKPKTPRKSPTKPKTNGAPKTPTKRKTNKGGANNESPTKKFKSEEKVSDSDASVKAENDEGEDGLPLRTKNDPFLPAPAVDKENEDAMFKEFCDTGAPVKNEKEMIENQVV
ncbi:hypothetical protein MGYG_03826 [Nannizzia gypsea CBS 118893]|uniref:Myb-like DNA-binding domain-containing protein n=1 Tax=Arthroderma gypseum (strain ATCC MYA-4604 / CBS 118893) TaxID=535722 RepID=E4UU55_ARTGP|nr:hypothetical protein MGYG_03826 [Nannizzia gypsea CBS 118893]EFR00822.1 hypothetical protein MGYG_03826 [Nannizzia gypsea CBS 118893]